MTSIPFSSEKIIFRNQSPSQTIYSTDLSNDLVSIVLLDFCYNDIMSPALQVDNYIAGLPAWQQVICTTIRDWIRTAEPKIEEQIKFTNRPYFIYKGNVAALLATKDHVNVFIYDPVAPDPKQLINQGQRNATARSIQIYNGQKIDRVAFIELIQAVVANNEAGGWRKLRGSHLAS